MSDDDNEDRDWRLRSYGYQPGEAGNAGVSSYDSVETARNKMDAERNKSTSTYTGTGAFDTSTTQASGVSETWRSGSASQGIGAKTFLLMLISPFLIGMAVIAWTEKNQVIDYVNNKWRDHVWKQGVTKRIESYSDFSRLSDWPRRVQETYRKQQDKPLATLLDEVPANLNTLSPAKKEELGAQIWFKISSKGTNAASYLTGIQAEPHRVVNPVLRAGSLSILFLQKECAKGIEIACLDAAKSFAGMVWYGDGPFEDGWVNEKALKQLPTSGPLSGLPAIQSLREKIARTRSLDGPQYLMRH